MRSLVFAAAIAASTIATPALANEARVELRTGIAWVSGVSDETLGVAVGYDADISEAAFVGVEAVADTNFDFADPILGVNGRLGAKVGDAGKLFGTVGYARDTTFDLDDWTLGAGYQHNLGSNMLLSAQYQRYMDTDVNRASIGFGFRF